MKPIADLHSHTNVSNHAFASLEEMINAARKNNLQALALTDHGPEMPDSPHMWYFTNLLRLPNIVENDFLLLRGVEADVIDKTGKLDIADSLASRLDWVVASMHNACLVPMDKQETTEAWLCVAHNPFVDMIGHAEQRQYYFNYDAVTKVFTQKNKVVEMNEGSGLSRPGNEEYMRELAIACKKNRTKIAITSDAHNTFTLGHYNNVVAMLQDIDFPQENIVNISIDNLVSELELHGKPFVGCLGEKLHDVFNRSK